MTPRRAAWLALAGGVVGAALGVARAWIPGLGGDGNYQAEGFLSGVITAVVWVVALGWLGAYLALAVPWVRAAREGPAAASPGMVATAALIGAQLGSLVVSPVVGLVARFVPFLLMPLGTGAALAGAWWGASLGARVPLPGWRHPRARVAQAVLTVLLVGAGLAWAFEPPGFPAGEDAGRRRAWAQATFGEPYQEAERFILAHPEVREQLGLVSEIAPVEGPNRTASTPGELMGAFTLELRGQQGRGTARLEFMKTATYRFTGKLQTPRGDFELPAL